MVKTANWAKDYFVVRKVLGVKIEFSVASNTFYFQLSFLLTLT